MTPEQLARDAVRVVDRAERATLRRIDQYLASIERDTRQLLSTLELRDNTRARAFLELRARQAFAQTTAARELLALGNANGPLATEFRAGIRAAYLDGIRSARDAAIATGIVSGAEASLALGFGARVDLPFLESLAGTTVTRLERVTRAAHDGISDAIARGAVRGAGPRATARLVRASVDLTRYEAERITRTVFMRANNEARDGTYREMGVEFVQWDATNDERTCEYCEARHGVVWKLREAPSAPAHPHCRCVHLPWRESSTSRGDAYYERTRGEMRERRESEGRAATTATARAPFERSDGIQVAKPAWAPGRGWLK